MSETIDPPPSRAQSPAVVTPAKALAVVKAAVSTILAADKLDILGKLALEINSFEPDTSSNAGRKKIASIAAKVATSKMDLVRLANGLMESDRARIKTILGERNIIEARMDELRDRMRAPLNAYEDAEKARIAGHEAALAEIEFLANVDGATADDINGRIWDVPTAEAREWQEFAPRAERAIEVTVARLRTAHAAAVIREAEAAELARLKAEEAARIAAANEARRIEREAQIAADARARAEIEAEGRIASERAAAARALADAEARAKKLVEEAEAARIKRHQDALDAIDAASNVVVGSSSATIRASIAALLNRPDRDWEEFAERAADETSEAKRHMEMCLGHAETREAAEAKRAQEEAAGRAERDAAATVERERARVAASLAAKQAEDEKRQADQVHRASVAAAALADMILVLGVDFSAAEVANGSIWKRVIEAIADGKIAHCRIEF